MKAVIFAGGVGTRLWPLSRKKSPKQFEKLIEHKSTLQLTVERLQPEFRPEDIFISTGKAYGEKIHAQLPSLPKENIITEPLKKDVGPAVSLSMSYLAKRIGENEPVVILWSDHLVRRPDMFKKVLATAEKVVKEDGDRIVFIGQKPRFASDNLGWIQYGPVKRTDDDINFCEFEGFKYKPDKKLAREFFGDNKHCWNLGYFVTTPAFVQNLFKQFSPEIHSLTQKIIDAEGTPEYDRVLDEEYQKMPSINFDNAVLEQMEKKNAYVIVEDIGWSDVGAWEALKEALEGSKDDNITHGTVFLEDSSDNLVYNYEDGKMIVGIDLNDYLVVNTKDVLLVAKKGSVSKIKKVVEGFEGTENEHLI